MFSAICVNSEGFNPDGMAAAKASGKQLGRPGGTGKSKLDKHLPEITELLKNGSTKILIAKKYGVSPPTLWAWLKKQNL